MIPNRRELGAEAIVHHIHHNSDVDAFKREVSINGNIYSVTLSSDQPEENIEFLSSKALEILKQLIKEGK